MKTQKIFPLPNQHGEGTDGIDHPYTEYYIDSALQTPLIDYSYRYDDDGKLIIDEETGRPRYDRWDFWVEEDFLDDESATNQPPEIPVI